MSKKCTPLWREAHFEFRNQNVQNTPRSDHFWQLRCRKSARRCGAKHISKSKCTKHLSVGRLLEVEMWSDAVASEGSVQRLSKVETPGHEPRHGRPLVDIGLIYGEVAKGTTNQCSRTPPPPTRMSGTQWLNSGYPNMPEPPSSSTANCPRGPGYFQTPYWRTNPQTHVVGYVQGSRQQMDAASRRVMDRSVATDA